MRFFRWLLAGRARSEQAVECARQFPYGIDAEAYGEGWTSPASQLERRAHRSKGWTALEFRNALESALGEEKTLLDVPVTSMAAIERMPDVHAQDIPILWSHSRRDYAGSLRF